MPFPTPNSTADHGELEDLLGDASCDRDGHDLQARGLYLDVGPWQHHLFEMTAVLLPR